VRERERKRERKSGGEVPLRRHAKRRVRRDDDRRRAPNDDHPTETSRRRATGVALMELQVLLCWIHIVGESDILRLHPCRSADLRRCTTRVSSARGILHPSPSPPPSSSSSSSSLHRNNGGTHGKHPRRDCAFPPRLLPPPPHLRGTFALPESRVFPLSARRRSLLYTFVAPTDGIRYRSVQRDPTLRRRRRLSDSGRWMDRSRREVEGRPC